MRLIVFGATGQTGLAVIKRALKNKDLQVTAFVRSPSRIPKHLRNNVRILVGDVTDPEDVEGAIEGHDCVVSCLGTGWSFRATTLISTGIKNIVEAMRMHEVKYLSVVGVSFLLPEPGITTPYIMKAIVADHERALNILKQSQGIHWTIAMPPEISNQEGSKSYSTTIDKMDSYVVTTEDLADWLVNCVTNSDQMKEFERQLVGIKSIISPLSYFLYTLSGRFILICIGMLSAGIGIYRYF